MLQKQNTLPLPQNSMQMSGRAGRTIKVSVDAVTGSGIVV